MTRDRTAELDRAQSALRELVLAAGEVRLSFAERHGLNLADATAMSQLAAEQPLTATELARRLGLSRATTTSVIDRLVERRFVRRRVDPLDRRRIEVGLTATGRRALAGPRAHTHTALGTFTAKDLAVATVFFERLAAELRAG